MSSVGKALLAMSGASVVRTLRCGVSDGTKSLIASYAAIDPFSEIEKSRVSAERIPVRSLRAFGDVPADLRLDLRWADLSGSTPLNDVVAILSLAVAQQPEALLEFGTFCGSTTANFALNLPNATIHTIDLPPDSEEAERMIRGKPVDDWHLIQSRHLGGAFLGTPLADRIVQHTGDTGTYDYGVIRDPLSFFLIDASHTYEYVKSDTLRAFALAKGSCTFAWHDCDSLHPGVIRWLLELIQAGLPVVRVEGTIVACMLVDAADPRLRKLLLSQPGSGLPPPRHDA